MSEVRKLYNKYKRLYYQGIELPTAKEVTFRFVLEGGKSLLQREVFRLDRLLALTSIVEEGGRTRWLLEFHEFLPSQPRLFSLMLLHEMSHISNWRMEHGPAWDREAVRLGQVGALREIF